MPRPPVRYETMDIRLLEYLLEIEKYGNISKAAEEIHISQSALSQNLAKVETSLNTPLFCRRDKRLTPTKAGEIYLANARRMIEVQNNTMDSIQKLMKNKDKTIRFAMAPYFSATFGKRILSWLKRQYPEIIFEMAEIDSLLCEEALANEVMDVAIHCMPLKNCGFEQVLLYTEHFSLCVPDEMSWGGREIDPDAMSLCPLILPIKGTFFRQYFERFIKKQRYQFTGTYKTQTLNGARRMIEQGYGLSFLPSRMVHAYAGYQIYEVPDLTPCDVYFSYREDHPKSALLREILGIFRRGID